MADDGFVRWSPCRKAQDTEYTRGRAHLSLPSLEVHSWRMFEFCHPWTEVHVSPITKGGSGSETFLGLSVWEQWTHTHPPRDHRREPPKKRRPPDRCRWRPFFFRQPSAEETFTESQKMNASRSRTQKHTHTSTPTPMAHVVTDTTEETREYPPGHTPS